MRYKQRVDNEGFEVPSGKIYRIACCDCGLVHDFVFVSSDGSPIGVAARRNIRATAAKRRGERGMEERGIMTDKVIVSKRKLELALEVFSINCCGNKKYAKKYLDEILAHSQVVNSEPVGFVSITPVGLNNEVSVIWINKYKPKHGENLFTHPSATVPMDKYKEAPDTVPRAKYDKLLEALKEASKELYMYGYQDESKDRVNVILRQAIAEAEGKE